MFIREKQNFISSIDPKKDNGVDIYKDRPLTRSTLNKLELANIDFKYDVSLQLPCFAAIDITKTIMSNFDQNNVTDVPLYHTTMWDGSEKDSWAIYGSERGEQILVEIVYSWIDPHFLWFCLWFPDLNKKRSYPIDELFGEDILTEAIQPSGEKFGEIFVAPCSLRIRTIKTDPKIFLPSGKSLQDLVNLAADNPWVKFWNAFKSKEYELAALYIKQVCNVPKDKGAQTTFLNALLALSYLRAKQNGEAVNRFIQLGSDFHNSRLERYSDMCFFFAIQAAKEMKDLNESLAVMKRIAYEIPDLSSDLQPEVSNILCSYVVSVYVGVVVLCRRVLELALKNILVATYKKQISALIQECQQAGILKGGARSGLYPILVVAKWKGILTSNEFEIASNIKNFGNRIHESGGVENHIDAKYAIQRCIHVLRRLYSRKYSPQLG